MAPSASASLNAAQAFILPIRFSMANSLTFIWLYRGSELARFRSMLRVLLCDTNSSV